MSISSSVDYSWAAGWYAGRRVLVTGGTSGIGATIARAFANSGATVTATGVERGELDALQHDPEIGGGLRLLDVRDPQGIAAVVGELDRLDVLVNAAGVIARGAELDPIVFAQVLDVNLTGAMRLCTSCRSLLAASGRGAVLNLASMLSFFGGGLVPGYAASKGGIVQLTRSLAIAYASDGIRVNALAPGWIRTPLTVALQEDADRSRAILARTPLGRWGEARELAGAALFLCSPEASFVTGAVLTVDGGYSAA